MLGLGSGGRGRKARPLDDTPAARGARNSPRRGKRAVAQKLLMSESEFAEFTEFTEFAEWAGWSVDYAFAFSGFVCGSGGGF